MPLYEYECESCGKKFEKIQKFSDPPIKTCIYCSGPVHKLFSPPTFIFKGTGWYVTDYARKNSSPPDNGKKKHSPSDGDGKESSASNPAKSEKVSSD